MRYENAQKCDPLLAEAFFNNATLEWTEFKHAENAIRLYKEALKVKDDYFEAAYELANLCIVKDYCELALKYYKKALEIDENNEDARFGLAAA